jgi:photosystem II stability/assembly factor-like uncharacterized protein
MIRIFINAVAFFAIICIIILGAGCSRTEQKMEVPEIKVITMDNVHGVIAPDDDHIWITGNWGIIYHSSDGGESWTKQDSGVKDSEAILCDGVFLDTKNGWVVGIRGTILHTTDGGSTWTRQNTGTDRHLFGICFTDNEYGWAVGEWGAIIHTTDGGKTWQKQGEEFDRMLNNITFVDRKEGWIVGERGVIMHTTDGGASWSTQLPKAFERVDEEEELLNPAPSLFGVCFTDRNNGWACGIDGTIIRTTDGGQTWEELSSGTGKTLYTIFIKYGKGWIVGDKGTYIMSNDNGKTWELQKEVIKSKWPFRDIYFSSPQNGWAVGQGGSVIHTTDGGKTWEFRSGISYAMDFFEMPKALEFGGGVE